MAKDINSVQSGIVKENDVNNPSVHTYKGKNQFPQSFQHGSTSQYGYVDAVAAAKCEVGDVFPYKFVTDLNTFTMKSPLKSEVKMYSAAFKVPMEAIYPRNYEYLFKFTQKGDEAPQDSTDGNSPIFQSARAIFPLKSFVDRILQSIENYLLPDSLDSFIVGVNGYIKSILLLESVFSSGSLFSKFNIHLNPLLWSYTSRRSHTVSGVSFDKFFDTAFWSFFTNLINYDECYLIHESGGTDEDGYPIYVITPDSSKWNLPFKDTDGIFESFAYYCSPDRALELLRTGDWNIDFVDYQAIDTSVLSDDGLLIYPSNEYKPHIPLYLNIEPIVAYQLSCVHFFNNPRIDYLYTAKLWRDNLQTVVYRVGDFPTYEYNGSELLYDVVSFNVIEKMISSLADDNSFFDYFFSLFSFCRSLRYGDYFVGSRPEPIGVGDINLEDDDSGNINSLEVARKLQLTRLLHKVAITGPDQSQQIKYIFNGRLPEVPKDVPIRLSLEEFDVSGFETNNTGEAQLSDDSPNITTTNLRLTDSKFMFEVNIDEPCWLIVVQYYEAHRLYSSTIDRFAYHYDLYDDFVPDMQYIGDQDVKQSELLGVYGAQNVPFAYHLRNMEYKQRYSYVSGGFVDSLKSWAFVTDNNDGNPAYDHISPEYIRSSPSEFDRFYKSLTGHSLGTRFHFITMNTNVMAPYRQMVYSPEILA